MVECNKAQHKSAS